MVWVRCYQLRPRTQPPLERLIPRQKDSNIVIKTQPLQSPGGQINRNISESISRKIIFEQKTLKSTKQNMQDQTFHFYASNISTWATTDDDRDLSGLIELMNKDGRDYNLFWVPLPHRSTYDIRHYKPQVAGVVHCGLFNVKRKK